MIRIVGFGHNSAASMGSLADALMQAGDAGHGWQAARSVVQWSLIP